MKKTTSVILFNLSELTKLCKDIKGFCEEMEEVKVCTSSTSSAVAEIIESNNNGIFIFKVASAKELMQSMRILKKFKALNDERFFRSICLIEKYNNRVGELMAKYGCLDILLTSSRAKLITYKIEIWSKSFTSKWEKEEVALKDEDFSVKVSNDFDKWLTKAFGSNFSLMDSIKSKEREEISSLLLPPPVNIESGSISVELKQKINGKYIHHLSKFKDMFDKSVWLKMSKGIKFSDDQIFLKLSLEYAGEKILIDSEVKVKGIEKYDSHYDCIQLELCADSIKIIDEFIRLMEKRQQSIDDFLLKAKGY